MGVERIEEVEIDALKSYSQIYKKKQIRFEFISYTLSCDHSQVNIVSSRSANSDIIIHRIYAVKLLYYCEVRRFKEAPECQVIPCALHFFIFMICS